MRSKQPLYCSKIIETRSTVFPEADGAHRIPLAGGLQTTGSGGCLTEYSGVLKRRTFPIYPKRCARDLVAQRRRDGVELVPRVAALPPLRGGPSLRSLGVPGALEGLAAVALAAGALGGGPGQVVPHRRGLLVAEAVLAVRDPVHVQPLHVGASLEAPGAGVLDSPPLGLEVVDDLERLELQCVPDRQVAGPLLEGDAELGAAGRGPDHVEVPGLDCSPTAGCRSRWLDWLLGCCQDSLPASHGPRRHGRPTPCR